MTALFSEEQRRYAESMSQRQRAVLKALIMFPYPISASERADPLLYALIRRGLAQCVQYSAQGCPIWTATDAGRAVFKHLWPDEWRAMNPEAWLPHPHAQAPQS
ncbi:hypothetical protein [Pseudorhodoplanes sp.]|uniref:hypothetical protein n=1 Tax=Pseudorhodoplanes sp. TaxID=1934341 RepID=UPI003918A0F5